MASLKKHEEVFSRCLREMFYRVGEDYPNDDLTSNDEWYRLRSWSIKDEENFRKWMYKFVKYELRISKKRAEEMVIWFSMDYGWTNMGELPMKLFRT